MFRYSGYHNIDRNWQARANLIWISDPRYLEDFSNSLYGALRLFDHQHAGPLRPRPELERRDHGRQLAAAPTTS